MTSSSHGSELPTELGLPTDGDAEPRPGHAALQPGARVGRYVILSRLGAGGMGVVYAAHDPELDRKVAIKLLRPGLGGNPVGRARLLREAQALARLSHPNVVAVHDAGTHAQQVWLAMEFIEGQTLTAWLAGAEGGPRRRPAEVLAVIGQAARGVMAAHAAGLLHRDLKPDNIMVGRDGRVWVMDFGLARAQLDASEDAPLSDGLSDARATDATAGLTEVGALVGTPAYMAPEQFLGGRVDARTDEFSLCVTLWEVLHGERPFAGERVHELCLAITGGERRPPPRGAAVPGWLRRVCERGLAVDPDARFPSVAALLRALEQGRARARLRMGAAAGLVVVAGVSVALGWQEHRERQRVAACEADGASIAAVWGPSARAELQQALTATDAKVGPETAERVSQWLDRYASEWSEVRTQTCMHAEVDGTWSVDLLARAQWCLDDRRSQLEALVRTLSTSDGRVLERAVSAAWSLMELSPCGEQAALERLPLPPTEERTRMKAVREQLALVHAQTNAGRYDEGLALARTTLGEAEELGWPPLVAATRSRLGVLLTHTGMYAEAEAALEAAYFEAMEAGAVTLGVEAATSLVHVVGLRLARPVEAIRWSRLAELASLGLERADDPRRGNRLVATANVYTSTGQHAKAKAMLEEALALRIRALGPEHPQLDEIYNNLAIVHVDTGDRLEAKALFERVVAIRTEALGPRHPSVAAGLNNLGNIHRDLGEYAEAKEVHARALALKEERLGPKHPEVGTSLGNLALVLDALGERAEARALAERAVSISEAALGHDHPSVAHELVTLALVLERSGERAEARPRLERALAIYERVLGPEHPSVAQVLNNLGEILIDTGELEEGQALLERAVRIVESALGPAHPHLGYPLAKLANTALEEGRATMALSLAERALAVRAAEGVPAGERAQAAMLVAQALVATGGDRERARRLAQESHARMRELGPPQAKLLAELEVWMAKHGISPAPP